MTAITVQQLPNNKTTIRSKTIRPKVPPLRCPNYTPAAPLSIQGHPAPDARWGVEPDLMLRHTRCTQATHSWLFESASGRVICFDLSLAHASTEDPRNISINAGSYWCTITITLWNVQAQRLWIKKNKEMPLGELKAAADLSNKAWDKGIKGLTKHGLVKVLKQNDVLLCRLQD